MANEEHVAKLKEGVEAWNVWRMINPDISSDLRRAYLEEAELQNADLSKAQLRNAHLRKAQLRNADLSEAQLQNADLVGAQLQNADLVGAELQKADLIRAHLQEASLVAAQLENANLSEAELQDANLVGAELQDADLREAQLYKASLRNVQLQGADLRLAEFVRFNDTNIKGIRVDLRFGKPLERFWNPHFILKPRAIPWIELRRAYTGINFLLTLVALLAFLFPYVLQAGYLQGLNWFQATLVETTPAIRGALEDADTSVPLMNPGSTLIPYLESLTPCFAETCVGRPIIWLILGGNQSIFLVLFNLVLIVYNGLRFYVTQTVNILRDEEEQGGWSPYKEEVDQLIPLHITIKYIFFLAVASGLLNAITTLLRIVEVPVRVGG